MKNYIFKFVMLAGVSLLSLRTAASSGELPELPCEDGPEIVRFLRDCRPGGLPPGCWVKDDSERSKYALVVTTVAVSELGEKIKRSDRVHVYGGKVTYITRLIRPEGFWELSGDRKVALFSVPGGGGFGPEVQHLQSRLKELTTDGVSNRYRMERVSRKGEDYLLITQEMGEESLAQATEMMELIVKQTNKELGLGRLPLGLRRRLPKAEKLVPARVEYLVRESDWVIESTRSYNSKGQLTNEQLEEDISGFRRIESLPEGWFEVPVGAEERYPKGLFVYAKASAVMYKNECFVSWEEFENPFFTVKDKEVTITIDKYINENKE